jgi:hypothetical protein
MPASGAVQRRTRANLCGTELGCHALRLPAPDFSLPDQLFAGGALPVGLTPDAMAAVVVGALARDRYREAGPGPFVDDTAMST